MRLPPILVVTAGVVFTSFSAILIRLSDAPPFVIAAYRMWFTTILLAPIVVLSRLRSRRRPGSRLPDGGIPGTLAARDSVRKPRVILLSVVSGVFLSVHFASWVTSLSYASVAGSTVIVTTHPLIVAVGGFLFLKEHLSWRAMIFMVGALAGGVVLVLGGFGEGGSQPLGYLLAFIGAVTVSGYMLIGRLVRQHLDANRYTLIVYSVSAVLLTVYAVIAGDPLFGYSLRELLIFLALAVVCTLLGHSLFNWALRFISTTVISTSILGEPVIASVLAVVIFAEIPSVYTLVGGIIILGSIFLFVRESSRSRITAAGRG